jgi:MFS transporter, DHA1 family, tetracycline resistance protein
MTTTAAPLAAPVPRRLFGYDRAQLIIFLIVVVNLLGFGIIIPLLPFYAQSLGASPFTVGLIFATYSVCQLVANPILGALSDRHGRRPILLYSILGTAASFMLLALAGNVVLLFLARAIDGLSGGNISTARAYVADVTEGDDRARGFGLIGAAFGIGFILGPALGGALSRFGYAAPAWAAAGLALLASALTFLWLPETVRGPRDGREAPPPQRVGDLLGRAGVRRLLALDFGYWVAFAVYQTTFALFVAQRFGFDAVATGQALALAGVVNMLVQLKVMPALASRVGERVTLAAGLGFGAAGLSAVAISPSVPVFLAGVVLASLGVGLAGPSLVTLLSETVEPEQQGRLQGISSALESLGRTVGPLWGNGALGLFGEAAPYASGAALLVGLAAWAALSRSRRPRPPA